MFGQLKKKLYFPVAGYFRFFAAIRLKRWNPRIIVVTGSNGKTTLLHLLMSMPILLLFREYRQQGYYPFGSMECQVFSEGLLW